MEKKKNLPAEQCEELLKVLKDRFEQDTNSHKDQTEFNLQIPSSFTEEFEQN